MDVSNTDQWYPVDQFVYMAHHSSDDLTGVLYVHCNWPLAAHMRYTRNRALLATCLAPCISQPGGSHIHSHGDAIWAADWHSHCCWLLFTGGGGRVVRAWPPPFDVKK